VIIHTKQTGRRGNGFTARAYSSLWGGRQLWGRAERSRHVCARAHPGAEVCVDCDCLRVALGSLGRARVHNVAQLPEPSHKRLVAIGGPKGGDAVGGAETDGDVPHLVEGKIHRVDPKFAS
jgi:hypothetical protein